MKAKRLIALALAAVFMLSAAATPVFAAAALPQENAALEQQNDMGNTFFQRCICCEITFQKIIRFVCVESNSGFQCVAGSGTRFSVVTVAASRLPDCFSRPDGLLN